MSRSYLSTALLIGCTSLLFGSKPAPNPTPKKTSLFDSSVAPKPYGALPAKRQLAWHGVEVYGIIHFTPTTFENKEWGFGDASPATFNPTDFNAEQIIAAAKAGGLKGLSS
jgi:alpha-L-fucosidase